MEFRRHLLSRTPKSSSANRLNTLLKTNWSNFPPSLNNKCGHGHINDVFVASYFTWRHRLFGEVLSRGWCLCIFWHFKRVFTQGHTETHNHPRSHSLLGTTYSHQLTVHACFWGVGGSRSTCSSRLWFLSSHHTVTLAFQSLDIFVASLWPLHHHNRLMCVGSAHTYIWLRLAC